MPVSLSPVGRTFLDAVNRVLRSAGVIRGDTDPITTFTDLQHGATVQLAMIAIQDELSELVADNLIPTEKNTSGAITTVSGTRVYDLEEDFVQFYGTPQLYDSTRNLKIFEYPGGQNALGLAIFNYKTGLGNPIYWYWEEGETKQIGLYPVPQDVWNFAYDYEADVSVSNATDAMPFTTASEVNVFCRMATVRFKLLFQEDSVGKVATDPEHILAKATLLRMLTGKNPAGSYGPIYR